jgi:Mg/Co/Ni transporter MgtE
VRRFGPPELSQIVARLPVERAAQVLHSVEPAAAARVLRVTPPSVAGRLVAALHPHRVGAVVESLPVNDAVAALRDLDDEERRRVLGQLSPARSNELQRLLRFQPHTAGGLMTPDVFTAGPGEDIVAIRRRVTEHPPALEGLLTVFVVDRDRRVLGAYPPHVLLAGSGMMQPVPVVHAGDALSAVLELFGTTDALAVPVVDDQDRLIGAIAIDDVLDELLIERRRAHRFPHRRRRR